MRSSWCPLFLAIGCHGGTDPAPGAIAGATCEATDNALRFRCRADLDPPAAATWTAVGDDGTTRVFTTPAAATSEVVVWGLPRRMDVTWTVEAGEASATGSYRTGSLPNQLDPLHVTTTGSATVDGIGMVQYCGLSAWILILDDRGRVVWYEPTEAGPRGGGGYDFTAAGTVVRATAESVVEIAMDGTELWRATGFDRPLHHDVRRGGDHVYALNASEHDGYVLDGVYVLTDGELVAEWDLVGVATPRTESLSEFWSDDFPGAVDWSHGNSLWSDGSSLLISLRWQDAVVKIDADPASPDFGAVDWVLTGSTSTDFTGDFTWTDGGGFDGQHHASPVDGGLVLFDNRAFGLASRALRLDLDEGGFTASERDAWSFGYHCPIQGAAFALETGGVLATCATASRVLEFDPDAADPRFELAVSCGEEGQGGIGGSLLARGYPVDLP